MTAIAGMDVRENALLFTPSVAENWCSDYKSQCGGSAKKRKMDLQYDSAITFLDIYLILILKIPILPYSWLFYSQIQGN